MRRVVVVGHGMVGSRFVEELVGADPDVVVTVLGKEPLPAYNRVLLSSVVAGAKSPQALGLAGPAHPRVEVLTGVAAAGIACRLSGPNRTNPGASRCFTINCASAAANSRPQVNLLPSPSPKSIEALVSRKIWPLRLVSSSNCFTYNSSVRAQTFQSK